MKKNLGFTLIELLVVVSILAVLMMLSIPNFMAWKANTQLKSAATGIYNAMQKAKMGAIKENREWRVSFDTANGRYSIIDSGINRTFGDSDDITVETFDLSEYGSGVGYGHGTAGSPIGDSFGTDNVTFSGNRTAFDGRGMLGNLPGYVYLSNKEGTAYGIGVNSAAGNVTIKRWGDSDWN